MSDKNNPPEEAVTEVGSKPEAHEEEVALARNATEARLTSIGVKIESSGVRVELSGVRAKPGKVRVQLNNMPSKLQKELASNNMTVNVEGATVTIENTNTNTNGDTTTYRWMAISVSVLFCLISLTVSAKLLGWI